MAMPAYPTEWTVEMVRALPDDGNRYEVIGGELFVTPAPSWTHQRALDDPNGPGQEARPVSGEERPGILDHRRRQPPRRAVAA